MKTLIKNMIIRLPGILLVVLTMASALAQRPVHHIEIDQCDTIQFSVESWNGDRFVWDLYTELDWDTVNFATQNGNVERVPYFVDDMYEGKTVSVNFLEPGRYILRIMVWDEVTCTNNLRIFSVNVVEHVPIATITDSTACYGEPAVFKVVITGKGPWEAIWTYGDGTASINLYGEDEIEQMVKLPPLPPDTYEVWIKQIIDECSSNFFPSEKGRVVIYPKPTNSGIRPVKRD
jgi:hypothetical protein